MKLTRTETKSPTGYETVTNDAMLEVLFEIVARNLLSHGRELRTLLIKVIDFSTDGADHDFRRSLAYLADRKREADHIDQ